MIVCGVDVGVKGGIAFVEILHGCRLLIDWRRMPVTKDLVGKKPRNSVCPYGLHEILQLGLPRRKRTVGVIEAVTSSPQMGVVSAFSFGKSAGIAEALLRSSTDGTITVRPQVWKKHHGLINQDKAAGRKLAAEMFDVPDFNRPMNEGPAEAALIAAWFADTFDQTS